MPSRFFCPSCLTCQPLLPSLPPPSTTSLTNHECNPPKSLPPSPHPTSTPHLRLRLPPQDGILTLHGTDFSKDIMEQGVDIDRRMLDFLVRGKGGREGVRGRVVSTVPSKQSEVRGYSQRGSRLDEKCG